MSIAIADKKGIVYLSRECVQLGVCLAALYPLTALSLQQDFILIFALASAKDQACYYYDETNQITIGLVSGTPRMHHIRYLKDMLQTLYNAICMEKHDLPIHASMLQMQAGDTKKGLVFAGESGTGKDVFAQAIHNASARREKPFIALNCGALPRDLVESELFGYETGAFTGARKNGNIGKFELANGGTIFWMKSGRSPYRSRQSF